MLFCAREEELKVGCKIFFCTRLFWVLRRMVVGYPGDIFYF